MPTVFVSENIERIERAIERLKANKEGLRDSIETQMNEIQEEIFRLEGCALAFKGFRDAGIEKLIPEDEKETHSNHEKEEGHHRNHEQEEGHHRNHEQEEGHHSNHEKEEGHHSNHEKEDTRSNKNWIKTGCHMI
mgnify:FL=1|jgi:hypothetical protein